MPEKPEKKRTVLVIEDTVSIRQFVVWTLEMEGHKVLSAENGDQGLAAARENPVSMVLLDVRMPGRDGWTVLREMKADPTLAHIPVVMLTASVAVSQRKKALEMGAADYLSKPIGVLALNSCVSRILGQSG